MSNIAMQALGGQQGMTADLPPPMEPLTVDERQMLLDLISAALSNERPTTRERFNALVGLLLKVRGGYT